MFMLPLQSLSSSGMKLSEVGWCVKCWSGFLDFGIRYTVYDIWYTVF